MPRNLLFSCEIAMKCYYSGMLYTLESGIGELYGVGMGVAWVSLSFPKATA